MATVSYVVTGYAKDTIIVKIMVDDKVEFAHLQWNGAVPLDDYLKPAVNQIAFQMTKISPKRDLASAVGHSGHFEVEDPSKILPPQPAPR